MYRKRERTQNWSLEEKKYLLELVKSRLDVLENKRIDSASSAMKGMAWQDIHAAFAARFGNDRDAHRVREQWRRMKGQARTEMMEFAERVRSYGADVANQRWPSSLSEDVWKTLESARKINDYQQGYGTGDDIGSPITMDDDDDDGDDLLMDADNGRGGAVDRMQQMQQMQQMQNGVKMEPPDTGDRFDPLDQSHELGDHEAIMSEEAAAGLMSMLRPKVELNDVPELDTSMVPSGLSITAVKIGSGGLKRRLVDRHDLSARNNSSWDSPYPNSSATPQHQHDRHGNSAHGQHGHNQHGHNQHGHNQLGHNQHGHNQLGHGQQGYGQQGYGQQGNAQGHGATATPTARSATPQQHQQQNNHPAPSIQESKRLEYRRRLEMMEEEHSIKLELLRVEKKTAEIKRRIALRDLSAPTCRSCGAAWERETNGVGPSASDATAAKKRASASASTPLQRNVKSDVHVELDLDNDASAASVPSSVASVASVATAGSPPSPGEGSEAEVSRSSSLNAQLGDDGGGAADHAEDDDSTNQGQVRFVGGLGEPGSGAGKGGGSGGSIRDAGGSMGKREAAFEDEYFYKQQKEQLQKLKTDLADEIGFHEEQIKRHQEAIARHKQRVNDLDKDN